MFITVLFRISKTCKLPKCLSINSGLTMVKPTVVQLYQGILFSNKKELVIHKAVWMNLKRTVLSKKINLKKFQDSIYTTFLNNKITKMETRLVARNQGWGKCGYKGILQKSPIVMVQICSFIVVMLTYPFKIAQIYIHTHKCIYNQGNVNKFSGL